MTLAAKQTTAMISIPTKAPTPIVASSEGISRAPAHSSEATSMDLSSRTAPASRSPSHLGGLLLVVAQMCSKSLRSSFNSDWSGELRASEDDPPC